MLCNYSVAHVAQQAVLGGVQPRLIQRDSAGPKVQTLTLLYSCFGKVVPEKRKAYMTIPKGSLGID